jgi:hypothetical protein
LVFAQAEAANPMPATKRPMKIQLNLPRSSFRQANGAWTDSDRSVAHGGRPSPWQPMEAAAASDSASHLCRHHRGARCDTPVMIMPTDKPPLLWPQLPGQKAAAAAVVGRHCRDQNCQTVAGGGVVPPPPPCSHAARQDKAVDIFNQGVKRKTTPPSLGSLGKDSHGSLPNISLSRRADPRFEIALRNTYKKTKL